MTKQTPILSDWSLCVDESEVGTLVRIRGKVRNHPSLEDDTVMLTSPIEIIHFSKQLAKTLSGTIYFLKDLDIYSMEECRKPTWRAGDMVMSDEDNPLTTFG